MTTCPHCKATDYYVQAVDPGPGRWCRWWKCLSCRDLFMFGGDQRVWRRRPDAQLDDFERSLVAHLQCYIFGHRNCLPEIWTKTIRVDRDGVMRSDYFGELGPTSILATRSEACPLPPAGSA